MNDEGTGYVAHIKMRKVQKISRKAVRGERGEGDYYAL
jgi:hypothetical protein